MVGLRRASVDIGSNSVRTMVIEWTSSGPYLIEDHGTMARIGDSISAGGTLRGEAMEQAGQAVRVGAEAARRLGAHLTCFATAGLRDLTNRQEAVSRLERALGAPIVLITGDEEALLSYAGVAASLPGGADDRPLVTMDVGGGSTELAWGTARCPTTRSYPIGGRKLLAALPALGAEGPLPSSSLNDAVGWAHSRLEAVRGQAPACARAVGVGGSVSTLAALQLGLERYDPMRVHGTRLDRDALRSLGERLRSVGKAERGRLIREPGRADLILPGWAIIMALLDRLGLDSIEANIFGPRLGILTEAGARVIAGRYREVA